MNCFDCKTELKIDFADVNKARDMFKVVLKCPKCKATFFATIYRDLNQSTGIIDCEKCEEKKDV